MARLPFRDQVLRDREDAIVAVAHRQLAAKGFERMTLDDVAAEVGVAKASLYKHFRSKEALAAAAIVRVLDRALQAIDEQAAFPGLSANERLRAVTRWALSAQLRGEIPALPAANSSLRAELLATPSCRDRLTTLSERLRAWIAEAQAAGDIAPRLPPELVLFTLFARACDPVPGLLKAGGGCDEAQIVDWVMSTCFDGLARQPER